MDSTIFMDTLICFTPILYPSFLVRNGKKEVLGNTQIEAFQENPPDRRQRRIGGENRIRSGIDHPRRLAVYSRESRGYLLLYYALNIPHANNEGGRYDRDGSDHGGSQQPWPKPKKGFATMIKLIDDDVTHIVIASDS